MKTLAIWTPTQQVTEGFEAGTGDTFGTLTDADAGSFEINMNEDGGSLAEVGAKLSNPVSGVWALFTEFDFTFSRRNDVPTRTRSCACVSFV